MKIVYFGWNEMVASLRAPAASGTRLLPAPREPFVVVSYCRWGQLAVVCRRKLPNMETSRIPCYVC
jgi:hypothetical protein